MCLPRKTATSEDATTQPAPQSHGVANWFNVERLGHVVGHEEPRGDQVAHKSQKMS